MRNWSASVAGAVIVLAAAPAPAWAQSARDILTQASFADRDKPTALRRVAAAYAAAGSALRQNPGDQEALLMQASAVGYRAKLNGNRADAIAARKALEAIVAHNPRFADAQLALGAWHVGAVFNLGRFVARAAVGAQKATGFAALDRAVASGGDRAFFPGLAALLRLELDPADARGRALAEAATHAGVASPLDRIMQRAATTVLVPLRAGKMDEAKAVAALLLPFGRIEQK